MSSRTRFYRDKQNGKWLGVCAGLADYTGIDVVWWRIGAVVGTLTFAPVLPLVYIVTAIIADKKPAQLYDDRPEDKQFWQKVRVAPQRTIRDVHSQFRALDRRMSGIERHVTTQNTALANEIDALR